MNTRRNLLKVEQSRRCFGCDRGTNLTHKGAGPPHLVHVGPVAISLPRPAPSFSGKHYKAKRYCPVDSFGSFVYSFGGASEQDSRKQNSRAQGSAMRAVTNLREPEPLSAATGGKLALFAENRRGERERAPPGEGEEEELN